MYWLSIKGKVDHMESDSGFRSKSFAMSLRFLPPFVKILLRLILRVFSDSHDDSLPACMLRHMHSNF